MVEPTPLKHMKVSWDDDIPNIWNNKTYSKPPTSCTCKGHSAQGPQVRLLGNCQYPSRIQELLEQSIKLPIVWVTLTFYPTIVHHGSHYIYIHPQNDYLCIFRIPLYPTYPGWTVRNHKIKQKQYISGWWFQP